MHFSIAQNRRWCYNIYLWGSDRHRQHHRLHSQCYTLSHHPRSQLTTSDQDGETSQIARLSHGIASSQCWYLLLASCYLHILSHTAVSPGGSSTAQRQPLWRKQQVRPMKSSYWANTNPGFPRRLANFLGIAEHYRLEHRPGRISRSGFLIWNRVRQCCAMIIISNWWNRSNFIAVTYPPNHWEAVCKLRYVGARGAACTSTKWVERS